MSDDLTLAECDGVIKCYHDKIKKNPKADHDLYWKQIDRWLDLRLEVMEHDAIQSSQGLEEMFAL